MGKNISATAVGDPHALRVAKHLVKRYNYVIAESGVRGWKKVKVDPFPSGVGKKATKFAFPKGQTAHGDFLVSQDGKTWKVVEAKYSAKAPYTTQQVIHYRNINRSGGKITFVGRILKGTAPKGFTVRETLTLYSSDLDAYEKGQIGWDELEKERVNTVSKSQKAREASELKRKARTFASTKPAVARSGEIGGTVDSNSSESRGTNSNGTGAETQKKPSSASQRPNALSTRSGIKGKALDLKKIRASAAKAIKPRIGIAKNLAKGVGKGLIIGFVVGLVESYLFNKLAGWLLKDEGVKRLNALEKRKGQEIERRVQRAIEDHVKKLPRRSGRKIVLEFRLVNMIAIGDIYLPHDLLIDEVYVTEFYWTKKEECVEAEVTPDVTALPAVYREGRKVELHYPESWFQVLKCTRILDFDFPDVGEPPLEGEWRSFFIDKDGPDKQHLATYTITFSGAKPKISGTSASDNRKLRIWDEEWTGTILKLKVKHGKYTEHIRVLFDEWDTLTGWSDLYEGYSRMQPTSSEQWERITEEEKQFVEIIKKGAAYLRVN